MLYNFRQVVCHFYVHHIITVELSCVKIIYNYQYLNIKAELLKILSFLIVSYSSKTSTSGKYIFAASINSLPK